MMERTSGAITLEIAENILRHCPEIVAVAPYTLTYGTFKYEGKKWQGSARGVTDTFIDLNKLRMKEGRFISNLDEQTYFCVIGKRVEKTLRSFGTTSMIGTQMFFQNKLFTIIGVIEDTPEGGMRPYETNEGIMIPISLVKRFEQADEIANIIARIRPEGNHITASRQVTDYFSMAINNLTIRVRSAEEIINQMQKQMRLFTLLLGAIGSISLIVGGVGVMNVMLVSVAERKKEIGIRRALGAQRSDIQIQFIIESILLCLVGGLLGIGLGIGVSYGISVFSQWHFTVSYDAILFGVVVSAAVGIFFGFYPARQASRLNPIDALRSE
jgi:putative ABC transport system permease protein